jgi:molybdopterin converting factor subunit 1
MEIQLRFFASIREKLRRTEATYTLPADATVDDLLDQLCGEYAALADMRGALRVAVNQEYVDPQHRLSDNDEVALIPPVSGGLDVRNRCARD